MGVVNKNRTNMQSKIFLELAKENHICMWLKKRFSFSIRTELTIFQKVPQNNSLSDSDTFS